MEQKAQGAIEYLLIIGAAILVVAIVVVALSGIVTSGTSASDANAVKDTYNSLNCQKDVNAMGRVNAALDCNAVTGCKNNCKCYVSFPKVTPCP